MRINHSPKSWISVPVAQRQPSAHEDVLSVGGKCYIDPGKIFCISFEQDLSHSFGMKMTDIVFRFCTASMICEFLKDRF